MNIQVCVCVYILHTDKFSLMVLKKNKTYQLEAVTGIYLFIGGGA